MKLKNIYKISQSEILANSGYLIANSNDYESFAISYWLPAISQLTPFNY